MNKKEYYPAEEEFIERFIPNIYPAINSFVAAYKRFIPPDFSQPFTFIDLGCGRAKTLIVNALLYPNAQFYGIDFNEKSINYAKDQVKKLGIKNITFICDSFENLKNYSLPDFDYISMAGLYTWLTPSARKAIREFVKNKLKKDGILYLEFASIPGAIETAIFWRFIREIVPRDINDESKIDMAIELFEIFISRPTRYLMDHIKVRSVVSRYLKKDAEQRKHLLHNVLPEYAFPMYFFEIYDDFIDTGVIFAGRMELELNDPELSLFPSQIPTVMRFKENVRIRETIIDFILNIGEHHDVWVKDGIHAKDDAISFIAERYFLLPRQSPEKLRRQIQLPGGHKIHLSENIYDFFYSCGEGPIRIFDHPEFEKNKEATLKAFYKIAASGEFFICCNSKDVNLSIPKYELPDTFKISIENQLLIDFSFTLLTGTILVSKVTRGAAVQLNPIETILLKFALEYGKNSAIDETYKYLTSINRQITYRGETRLTKEIKREEVEKEAKTLFSGRKAFNLQRLKIIL